MHERLPIVQAGGIAGFSSISCASWRVAVIRSDTCAWIKQKWKCSYCSHALVFCEACPAKRGRSVILMARDSVQRNALDLRARAAKEPNNDKADANAGHFSLGNDLRFPAKRPFRGIQRSRHIGPGNECRAAAELEDCIRQRLVSRRSDPGRATAQEVNASPLLGEARRR